MIKATCCAAVHCCGGRLYKKAVEERAVRTSQLNGWGVTCPCIMRLVFGYRKSPHNCGAILKVSDARRRPRRQRSSSSCRSVRSCAVRSERLRRFLEAFGRLAGHQEYRSRRLNAGHKERMRRRCSAWTMSARCVGWQVMAEGRHCRREFIFTSPHEVSAVSPVA